MGLIFLSAIVVFGFRDGLNITFAFNPEYIFYIILVILIFYIGYFGIKQENIFINSPIVENGKKTTEEKYKKSGVKASKASELYENLLQYMQKEKPYLHPKLSLSELAQELELSTNQLSQIINQQAGVNFYDFVNKYRVEEFLRQADKNRHFSLLALAHDAGFNSKSSFNYIFKKQKGLSPSQYLTKIAEKPK
jgi:AraC-like DNA-binding protein